MSESCKRFQGRSAKSNFCSATGQLTPQEKSPKSLWHFFGHLMVEMSFNPIFNSLIIFSLLHFGIIESRFHCFRSPKLKNLWFLNCWTYVWWPFYSPINGLISNISSLNYILWRWRFENDSNGINRVYNSLDMNFIFIKKHETDIWYILQTFRFSRKGIIQY